MDMSGWRLRVRWYTASRFRAMMSVIRVGRLERGRADVRAGVVHQAIQATVRALDVGDHLRTASLGGDICDDRRNFSLHCEGTQEGDRLLELVRASAVDDDGGTEFYKLARRLEPDALAAPSDERDAPVESHYSCRERKDAGWISAPPCLSGRDGKV